MSEQPRVLYDPGYAWTTFEGPGGFTQLTMDERNARAIAEALGVEFVRCRPGTTIPVTTRQPSGSTS